MKRASAFVLLLSVVAAAAGMLGQRALADGLPVLGIDDGASGIATSAGGARYVTLPAGNGTVVARINPAGGRVIASRLLRGSLTIPAVAYDGTPGGLSHDGRTLVLIEPRQSFPRAETTLRVLATRDLRTLRAIRLHGDFSFDAVSPSGSRMFLIQYTNPTDPSRYLVRAYDLRAGRMLSKPVTDPREETDKMRGAPITRIASPDGRLAFTLYDGAGATPFVHALDTASGTARCIDLEGLSGYSALWRLRLTLTGGTLTVHDGREPEALIDTRTYKVASPAKPAAAIATSGTSHGLRPARLGIAALVALIALGAGASVARYRQRHRAATG